MAETVLRAELGAAGLDGAVVVDSAGTGDWHVGDTMDPDARKALAGRGHDGSAHRARQFEPSWLSRYDLILAMDSRNLADLRRMARAQGEDTDRIRLFGEVGEIGGQDIPDPWGGGPDEFGHVLDLLGAAAPVITGRLARLLETAG
jgi:protein-tyrosine phosphatase